MDRVFGVWYENRVLDAGSKMVLVLLLSYVLIFIYNLLGGRPVMRWNDFPAEVVAAVAIASFAAFFFASHQHRKYRRHLQQHAEKLTMKLRQKG
ncbi:MAG TPA: hypothetical protein VJI13_04695 [Candidatus Norongarragalinales archaeon]|nr:hypothetical protein [Candidatus Norongarragalinales archaeon]